MKIQINNTLEFFFTALIMLALGAVVYGTIIMYLWNWLMPIIFGLGKLTWIQAYGLTLLTHSLFIHSVSNSNKSEQ